MRELLAMHRAIHILGSAVLQFMKNSVTAQTSAEVFGAFTCNSRVLAVQLSMSFQQGVVCIESVRMWKQD